MQNKYLRHKAVIRKGGRFQITSGRIALFLAGAVFAALLTLVAIEAHQYTERAHFMCPNMHFGIMAKVIF